MFIALDLAIAYIRIGASTAFIVTIWCFICLSNCLFEQYSVEPYNATPLLAL